METPSLRGRKMIWKIGCGILNLNDSKGPLPQIVFSSSDEFIRNSNISFENPIVAENGAPPIVKMYSRRK